MVKDYSKGKIYKIEGGGLTYVGSTIQRLCNRLAKHRSGFKQGRNCSSKEVLCFADAIITLVELYPCGSEDELRMRERYWYDLIPCVNKNRPWVSEQEQVEGNKIKCKEYLEANRDKVKAYREANKEHKNTYNKEYHEANKEKHKAYMKKYYARKKAEKAETI